MVRLLALAAAAAALNAVTPAAHAQKDDASTPPAGWKEYSPRDGTYTVWVPEKTRSRSERERTSTVSGQRLKVHVLALEMNGGPSLLVEELIISAALAKKFKPGELSNLFRDMIASESGGRVADESDVKAGTVVGKEYRVESARGVTRARVFVSGGRALMLRATGKKAQVEGEAVDTFLDSGRLLTGAAAAAARSKADNAPTILGGAFDPEFRDDAPDGAMLVGFEIGFGDFLGRAMIRTARPIYRTADGKEKTGAIHGTQVANGIVVKAKKGYAVGGMAVKHGLGFDGMSLTYMKVADGKLDPSDSYESQFVGSNEDKVPTKITGNGMPVVGIVGKSNGKDMTGMGLLFQGQSFEAKKK